MATRRPRRHGLGQALAVRRTDQIDLAYFDHSHVVSAAIAPMLNQDHELVGAYFAESTAEGFFEQRAGIEQTRARASAWRSGWRRTLAGPAGRAGLSCAAVPRVTTPATATPTCRSPGRKAPVHF